MCFHNHSDVCGLHIYQNNHTTDTRVVRTSRLVTHPSSDCPILWPCSPEAPKNATKHWATQVSEGSSAGRWGSDRQRVPTRVLTPTQRWGDDLGGAGEAPSTASTHKWVKDPALPGWRAPLSSGLWKETQESLWGKGPSVCTTQPIYLISQ